MSSLHLTSYITSPLFLEEIKNKKLPYDLILSDLDVAKKATNESLFSYRANAIAQAKHPLLILSQLPLSTITTPLAKALDCGAPNKPACWEQGITIINLYVGMGSLGRKLTPEFQDITQPRNLPTYEPLDLINLFQILEQPHAKYLRIPHQHFPESIFSTEEIGIIDAQTLTTIKTLNLTNYGYAGDKGTIIATGANFATALQLGDILTEQGRPMDTFVLSQISFDFTEDIRSSLHKTKKLVRISDFLPTDEFRDRLTYEALQQKNLQHIQVQFLSPKYEHLTTIFDEFSAEQAEFDAKGLAGRIE